MFDLFTSCVIIVASIVLWRAVDDIEVDPSLEERDRRLGGHGQLALFNEALRTREVPSGADREAWKRELKGKNFRLPRRVRILMFIVVAAVVARIVDDLRTATAREVWAFLALLAGAAALIWIVPTIAQRLSRTKPFDARQLLLAELEKD